MCKLLVDGPVVGGYRWVIRSFRHKGLEELWTTGATRRVDARIHRRILQLLSMLNAVPTAEDMNLPGARFHGLLGFRPIRYTVHVNGPWCITFEFEGADAYRVDYEQYH